MFTTPWDNMGSYTQFLTTKSNLCFQVSIYAFAYVLFHPSWKEVGIVFLVDALALIISILIDRKLFTKKHPEFLPIFPLEKLEVIANFSTESQIDFLKSLKEFPTKRAKYLVWHSFFKTIPAMLIISFYWDHQDSLQHFFKIFTFEVFFHVIVYSYLFFEQHSLVSSKIAQYHQLYNWTSAFEIMANEEFLERQEKSPKKQEGILLVSCGLAIFFAQIVAFTSTSLNSWEVLLTSAAGFILMWRGIILSRNFFLGGLERIHDYFSNYQIGRPSLPLSTSPILFRFNIVFNRLANKIKGHERSLAALTMKQVDNHNLIAIGEMSAILAHDLAAPLHTLKFCLEELEVSPEKFSRYLPQMKSSVHQNWLLVNSLKNTLKNSNAPYTYFEECHQNILNLLKIKFKTEVFSRLHFILNNGAPDSPLAISRSSFSHILFNIYSNALANMMEHKRDKYLIEVRVQVKSSDSIELIISDQGSGLSIDFFEKITSYNFIEEHDLKFKKGLGLRLSRRLIESHQGSMSVMRDPVHNFKTSIAIRLPLYQFSNVHINQGMAMEGVVYE